jgi:trans-aconitate methyltransferase
MINDTLRAYDQHAAEWAEKHSDEDYWRENREWLFLHLEPQDRIIEFGTGPGDEGARLIQAGLDYTGIDGSVGMLTLARQKIPSERLRLMDLRDLGLADNEEPFDGFWSTATLLHIPKTEINHVLSLMRGMLKSKTPGFIAMRDGEGEIQNNKLPHPRLFSFWGRGEFAEVLKGCGFTIEEAYSETHNEHLWHCYRVWTS